MTNDNRSPNTLERVATYTRLTLLTVCIGLLLGILAIVSFQVLAREVAVVSVWTEELSRWFFIYFSFLGCSFLSVRNDHVRIDVFLEVDAIKRASPWSSPIISLLRLLFYIFFVVAGISAVSQFGNAPSASMGLTRGYMYAALPVAFVLAGVLEIFRFIGACRNLLQNIIKPRKEN